MAGRIFYWVFNMSLTASLMGCLVLLLRMIKAIPRRIFIFLWLVPFVRMCVPIGLGNPYSLMSLLTRFTGKTVEVWKPAEGPGMYFTNMVQAAESYSPVVYKVWIYETLFNVGAFVWIVGALAVLIVLAVLYRSTIKEMRDAVPLKENVYLSEKIEGPAVYGIFRPRIVLPASSAGRDLRYILAHEETHIRRGDNLWRLLGFFAAAVHWFNPLSWVFLKAFLADLELACDEKAVAALNEPERREYAAMLLDCAESRNVFASAFGGAKIRTRIENVLSFKRMTGAAVICLSAFTAAIIVTLITNAG